MRFYTNVQQAGNNLLVREYDKGTRKQYKLPYRPTLFVPTNKPSKFKTLDGKTVGAVQLAVSEKPKSGLNNTKM